MTRLSVSDLNSYLEERIRRALDGGVPARRELEVQLEPAHLGRLDIHISLDEHAAVTVQVKASNPQALAPLESQSADLRNRLDQAGVPVREMRFQMAGGEGQSRQQFQRSPYEFEQTSENNSSKPANKGTVARGLYLKV